MVEGLHRCRDLMKTEVLKRPVFKNIRPKEDYEELISSIRKFIDSTTSKVENEVKSHLVCNSYLVFLYHDKVT